MTLITSRASWDTKNENICGTLVGHEPAKKMKKVAGHKNMKYKEQKKEENMCGSLVGHELA